MGIVIENSVLGAINDLNVPFPGSPHASHAFSASASAHTLISRMNTLSASSLLPPHAEYS